MIAGHISKIGPLLKQPSFTRVEAEERGVSGSLLAYYVNAGVLSRVGPGIFINPSKETDVDYKWQDLVRVAYSVKEGAICLLSALDLYGLTEEIPREFWIAIPHSMRAPKIPAAHFVRFRNMDLGRTTITLGGIKLSIFDKERTVLDAFRYLDREVAIKALRSLVQQGMDYKKMSIYGKRLRMDIEPYILAITA